MQVHLHTIHWQAYSLVKVIHLLIRYYKTRFFLWNTNNTDRNGVNKHWKGIVKQPYPPSLQFYQPLSFYGKNLNSPPPPPLPPSFWKFWKFNLNPPLIKGRGWGGVQLWGCSLKYFSKNATIYNSHNKSSIWYIFCNKHFQAFLEAQISKDQLISLLRKTTLLMWWPLMCFTHSCLFFCAVFIICKCNCKSLV